MRVQFAAIKHSVQQLKSNQSTKLLLHQAALMLIRFSIYGCIMKSQMYLILRHGYQFQELRVQIYPSILCQLFQDQYILLVVCAAVFVITKNQILLHLHREHLPLLMDQQRPVWTKMYYCQLRKTLSEQLIFGLFQEPISPLRVAERQQFVTIQQVSNKLFWLLQFLVAKNLKSCLLTLQTVKVLTVV